MDARHPQRIVSWRGIALLACAALALGAAGAAATAGDQAERPISLRWALGARVGDSPTPTAIQRDTSLEAGSKLKFLVEPTSPGAVYLLLLDAQGAIHVLYRESSAAAGEGDAAYIPPGRGWFELDEDAGLETFFLLASATPLTDLDALLDRYAAGDEASKPGLAEAIVDEVRRLHKAHRNFARPVEKPVMIGGRTRGQQDAHSAIDQLAVEVSADRFYAKTITIDH